MSVVFFMKYSHKRNNVPFTTLLWEERYKNYAGQYNLAGRKVETEDQVCVYMAIIKKVLQEFKIYLRNWGLINKIDKTTCQFTTGKSKNSLVFVCVLPNGFSRGPLNTKITRFNSNQSLLVCHKEMSRAD